MIQITLSAYNMGSTATEEDFDAWTAYVASHLHEHVPGLDPEGYSVERAALSGPGAAFADNVSGAADGSPWGSATDTEAPSWQDIREALSTDCWQAFCAS